MGHANRASTKTNAVQTIHTVGLNVNKIGTHKMPPQCIDLSNEVVVCIHHMDRMLAALIHDWDMHSCAAVFKGKGRGIKSTQLSNIVGKINNRK